MTKHIVEIEGHKLYVPKNHPHFDYHKHTGGWFYHAPTVGVCLKEGVSRKKWGSLRLTIASEAYMYWMDKAKENMPYYEKKEIIWINRALAWKHWCKSN